MLSAASEPGDTHTYIHTDIHRYTYIFYPYISPACCLSVCLSVCSTGPYFAGLLYNNPKYVNYPFFVAGSLKICYDLLLLHGFRASKTAGERDQEAAKAAAASKQPDRLAVEITPLRGDLKA